MSERESFQAAREAEHDIVLHPERELPHLGVIGQLVGAMMYQGSHHGDHGDHDAQARDDAEEARLGEGAVRRPQDGHQPARTRPARTR